MKHFDEAATRDALPFPLLIERLRQTFREGCHVPPRHVHRVEGSGGQGTVLIMPAWNERYLGIKTVNVFPSNAERGLPGLFAAYTLFDATTGALLAQADGNVITARRTAAASVLAASYLARSDARRLVVLGAGRVASVLPLAYAGVFALSEIEVWDRTPARAERLVETLVAAGLPASAVRDRESAVRRADIVSTATLATAPIVEGSWLAPGSHLDLIGSFAPEMREADDAALAGARVFVDTEEALGKSGDLVAPLASGRLRLEAIEGTLADLCRSTVGLRRDASKRTVFKSVGSALEDLAAAILVYEHAPGRAAPRR